MDEIDYMSDFLEESVASEIQSQSAFVSQSLADEISASGVKPPKPSLQSPRSAVRTPTTPHSARSRASSSADYSDDFDDEASQKSVHFAIPPRRASVPRISLGSIGSALGPVEESVRESDASNEGDADDYSMDFDASRSAIESPLPTNRSKKNTITPRAGKPPRPMGKRPSTLSLTIDPTIESINEDYSMDFDKSRDYSSHSISPVVTPGSGIGRRQRVRTISDELGPRRGSMSTAAEDSEYSMDFDKSMAESRDSYTTDFDKTMSSPPGRLSQTSHSQSHSSFPSYGADDFEEDTQAGSVVLNVTKDEEVATPMVPAPTVEEFMPSFVPVHVWELRKKLMSTMDKAVNLGEQTTVEKPTKAKDELIRSRHYLEEGLESIETELLLVRRKQREDARERQKLARDKRRRAEERRAKHVSELAEARQRAERAESEAKDLQSNINELQAQLERMESIIESSKAAREKGEEALKSREEELVNTKTELDGVKESNLDLESKLKNLTSEYDEFKKDKREEIESQKKKYELEIGIMRGSLESIERRLEAERARLPEHHRLLIQQEEDRLRRLEETLESERAILRTEKETHRLESQQARERIVEEARDMRTKAMEQVADAKADLGQQRQKWERERAEARAKAEAEAARVQAEALSNDRLKTELELQRKRLVEDRAALSTRAALLAPQLRDLDEAQASLEKKMEEVDASAQEAQKSVDKAQAIMAEVKSKEIDLNHRWEQMCLREEEISKKIQAQQKERAAVEQTEKGLQGQRLQLYHQQMELSFQVQQVQRAISLLKRIDGNMPGQMRMALELSALAWDKSKVEVSPPPHPNVEELPAPPALQNHSAVKSPQPQGGPVGREPHGPFITQGIPNLGQNHDRRPLLQVTTPPTFPHNENRSSFEDYPVARSGTGPQQPFQKLPSPTYYESSPASNAWTAVDKAKRLVADDCSSNSLMKAHPSSIGEAAGNYQTKRQQPQEEEEDSLENWALKLKAAAIFSGAL